MSQTQPLTQAAYRALGTLLLDLSDSPDHPVIFSIVGRGPWYEDRDDWEGCRIIGSGPVADRTIAQLTRGGTRSAEAQAMLAQVRRAWSDLATPQAMTELRRSYQGRLDEGRRRARQTSQNAVRMIATSLLGTYQQARGGHPTRLETLMPDDQRRWLRVAEFIATSTPLHGLFRLVLVTDPVDDPSPVLGQENNRGIQSGDPDQVDIKEVRR